MCCTKGIRFGLKTGTDFDNYGLKSGLVIKETMRAAQYEERITLKDFAWNIARCHILLNDADFMWARLEVANLVQPLEAKFENGYGF